LPNVDISEVELFDLDTEHLDGFALESPVAGSRWDTFSIQFGGWVIGRERRVFALELAGTGLDGTRLPVALDRPDVAETGLGIEVQGRCGFRVDVSALGLPTNFTFTVSAVLAGDVRVDIARVSGTREPLKIARSRLNPILVTSLGRTGSTLVMRLLSLHPEIAAYPLFRTEPKVASYWADVMLALTDPRSYLQPVRSMIRGPNWWLGEARLVEEDFDDPELKDWLGAQQVTEVASFCRDRIEDFYERVAEGDQKYFAEKCVPRPLPYATVLSEIFPDVREIVLVRDFRDMLCSIFAYSKRFGSPIFGRELADSDDEYVRGNLAAQVDLLASGWKRRSGSAFLLRYEDLILEPHETLSSLFEYLGLASDPATLEQMTEGFSYGKNAAGETHGTSLSARESIGRWRTDLDPALVAACEDAFADAFETFGYTPGAPLHAAADSHS
jgi:hypothetical protein